MTKKANFQIGDGPVQKQYREQMNNLAAGIDEILNKDVRPRKVGFILMVFPFGTTTGRCNYVSNADREDVLRLLKEQVARFEGRVK